MVGKSNVATQICRKEWFKKANSTAELNSENTPAQTDETMGSWTEIKRLNSETEYTGFRAITMCCSVSYHKEDADTCSVCGGDHVKIERRLRCTSRTCSPDRKCPVVWKVHHCTGHDQWVVMVNHHAHERGAVPCLVEHKPRITNEIKAFISEQDENDATPRLIETRLKNSAALSLPPHGWPTLDQIKNALKRIREQEGSRNTIEGIEAFVARRVYTPALEHSREKAFVFGPRLDGNGIPVVASGTDDDPFILGVTSLQLIDNAIQYSQHGQFVIFHADATFKLSDVAYPVITCGYTDAARSYQLVGLFVVSQRTRRDFGMCFGALSALAQRVRGAALTADAIMGDADDAQYLGIQDVPSFSSAVPLMCYFHVLYNVRKKTSHLRKELRVIIMRSIDDMHYSESIEQFQTVRDTELQRWRSHPELKNFTDYFIKQWLSGRFWRWQIFHSLPASAVTNNPCEVYNSTIKSYTRRKRFHMAKLLAKLCDLVESFKTSAPARSDYQPTPTSDVVNAAIHMVSFWKTTLAYTAGAPCIRVKCKKDVSEEVQRLEESTFAETFDKGCDLPINVTDSKNDSARSEAEKKKGAALYTRASSWSLWRAHNIGMPDEGWLVNFENPNCGCRYFKKFQVCAHLLIVQNRQDLSALGKRRKILDRSRNTKRHKVDESKQPTRLLNGSKSATPSKDQQSTTRAWDWFSLANSPRERHKTCPQGDREQSRTWRDHQHSWAYYVSDEQSQAALEHHSYYVGDDQPYYVGNEQRQAALEYQQVHQQPWPIPVRYRQDEITQPIRFECGEHHHWRDQQQNIALQQQRHYFDWGSRQYNEQDETILVQHAPPSPPPVYFSDYAPRRRGRLPRASHALNVN